MNLLFLFTFLITQAVYANFFEEYPRQFKILKEKYKNQEKDIYKIQEFLALRFIDRTDWNNAKDLKKSIDNIYKPAPITWNQWKKVTFENVHKKASSNSPLDYQDLIDWSYLSVQNTTQASGFSKEYKKGLRGNIDDVKWGYIYYSYNGLSYDLIKRLESFQFLSEKDKSYKKLRIKWDTIKCHDRKNPDELGNHFPAQLSKDQSNCGTLIYPYGSYVEEGYKDLINLVNKRLEKKLNFKEAFEFSIDIQKQFVFLHPFHDGNGRSSRWLMDYIMLKSGHPVFVYNYMNQDMTMIDSQFKEESKKASLLLLRTLEKCLNSTSPYCQE